MTKPKGRSQLQKSQAVANLTKMKDDKQGNVASGSSDASMSTDPEIVRQAELETAGEHAATYEKCFQNASCQGQPY